MPAETGFPSNDATRRPDWLARRLLPAPAFPAPRARRWPTDRGFRPDAAQTASMTDSEPDYRFTLANERTFLAYVRTALALDGAGLAVVQFLTVVGSPRGREVVAGGLILAGLATSIAGFHRWRTIQAAMRRNEPLPASLMPLVITVVIAGGSAIAAISLVLRSFK